MISLDLIKEKVQTIAQLPALPAVASKVIQIVDDPGISTSSLGKLIATDQALTAKVLKIANSPFYGFPRKISTIEFAIIVLGYDALKEIVISTSLVSSLQDNSDSYFDKKAFRDHAIACGIMARRLARDLSYRVTGEVFVGGLLHDMGVSILHRHFGDEYRRIVGIVRETELTFVEAEESVLGVTHAEVGSWIAEQWNLPEQLVEAVALHHTPLKAVINPELTSLIHCADAMASRAPGMKAEFDKGTEFNREALNHLQANGAARIQDNIAAYESIMQTELAQVMQPDNGPTGGNQNHER